MADRSPSAQHTSILILQAWRERWSPLQWTSKLRRTLVEDGELTKTLPVALIEQATFGSTPNTLLLSYIKYAAINKVIPFSSVLKAIEQFEDVQEPSRCRTLLALLELLADIITNISCDGDKGDCVDLSVALSHISYWTLNCIVRLLISVVESVISPDDCQAISVCFTSVKKCKAIITELIENTVLRSLVIIGKRQDQYASMAWDHLLQSSLQNLSARQAQVLVNTDETNEVQEHLKVLVHDIKRLQSLSPSGERLPGIVPNLAVHILTYAQTFLYPGDEFDQMCSLADLVFRTQCLTRTQFYTELVRTCLVNLLQSSTSQEDAFCYSYLYHKIPYLILETEKKHNFGVDPVVIVTVLQQLLQFTQLWDCVDMKLGMNTYDTVCQQYIAKMPLPQIQQYYAPLRSKRVIPEKISAVEGQTRSPVQTFIAVENELNKILQILGMEQTKNSAHVIKTLVRPENLLWISLAAVNTGKLKEFSGAVLRLNETAESCRADIEDEKLADHRSELFHHSFVILCYIVVNFGKMAVLSSADNSGWGFFVRWVGLCITNNMDQPIANVITPCVDKSTVDDILEQFLRGKLPKLSTTHWGRSCWNVCQAVHELLTCATPLPDSFKKVCKDMVQTCPALAVCVLVWLSSYILRLPSEEREKPFSLLDMLINPITGTVPRTFPLLEILIDKLKIDVRRNTSLKTDEKDVTKTMSKLLSSSIQNGAVNMKSVNKFRSMMNSAGPSGFADVILKELLSQTRKEDVRKAADIGSMLVLLDPSSLSLSLLASVKSLIQQPKADFTLVDPVGWGLARLLSHATAIGLLREDPSHKKYDDEDNERPLKLQRFDENDKLWTPKSIIQQGIVTLFEEFCHSLNRREIGARAAFVMSFMEQAVSCTGLFSSPLLTCLQPHLIAEVLSYVPGSLPADYLLGLYDLESVEGRELCAKAICATVRT
ncbi:mediator of RNA polymerase II transcription subunit 24-like [Dendronephthya gigantea]|uniref:mediator of RNA polymerase II transcription subunit 24-like n=1 Tax=Dendronephthya gigantea TaxID=151771 RepID=UPI00106C3561|nr:mediator of RNA polymerase II transcription subunit 24-like [Dendronephthya gigantea]